MQSISSGHCYLRRSIVLPQFLLSTDLGTVVRGAVVVEGKVQVFRRDGLEEEAARLSRRVGVQLLRVRAHLLQGL